MNSQNRTRLIRYGSVCGGLLLLAFLIWLLLWRLDGIQSALAEMRQITDLMSRQAGYYWVGQVISGAALALAGGAVLAFRILEEPVLKAGPLAGYKAQGPGKQAGSQGWLGAFIGLLVVQALVFRGGGLASALYITPILFFVTAAVWLGIPDVALVRRLPFPRAGALIFHPAAPHSGKQD